MPPQFLIILQSISTITWEGTYQNWILGGLGGLLLLLIWAYNNKPAPVTTRVICTFLKLAALALLLACILEPKWKKNTILPRANTVAIVIDNSDSLNIPTSSSDKETRQDSVRVAFQKADTPTGWIANLETQFQVQRFSLGNQLNPISTFNQDAEPPSQTSPLASALKNLKSRFTRKPLAAVILVTDGHSSTPILDTDLEGLAPVFPILPPSSDIPPDLALSDIQITHSQFEDAPVTVQAKVKAQGFEGRQVEVRLLSPEGEIIESQSHEITSQELKPTIRFQFNPKTSGLAFHKLTIEEKVKEAIDPLTEATNTNNVSILTIEQPSQPFRILYLSGRPNWEYKFLQRAVKEDEQLHLVGLIRVAKKEARFEFRGRTGESSNPLFRGFKDENSGEEEQYDEAVLIRMNTRDKDELLNGFPKTSEELYPYHAVILDDIESSFFTHEQHALLENYVSKRGGGLMVLGGLEMFQDGGYPKTPIGNLFPLYLSKPTQNLTQENLEQNKWDLTREGWLTPWARLRSTENDEEEVHQQMPPLKVYNSTNGLKPGATVIAQLSGDPDSNADPLPAMAEQRVGQGRVIAMPVGDMWRWSMKNHETQPEHQKFWRQTLRHLLADVPEPSALKIQKNSEPGNEGVAIQLTARDESFKHLDNSEVRLTLTMPNGQKLNLPADRSESLPATWVTHHLPQESGTYTVEAEILESDGKTLISKLKAGWSTNHATHEHRDHTVNHAVLENLASKTGGKVHALNELPELAKKLPKLEAPVMHDWNKPLWHNPWVLALILSLLGAEWFIRRKHNLA